CILRLIRYAGAGTAIGITDQHPPELINSNVIEVEQVAAGIAPALVPDATTLHRVCRSGVGSGPGSAAVVSERDQQVPNTGEISRLSIAGRLCAQESKGGAAVVACNYFGKLGILNSERSTGIFGFRPVNASVVRNRDLRMAIGVHIPQVDGVVGACRN